MAKKGRKKSKNVYGTAQRGYQYNTISDRLLRRRLNYIKYYDKVQNLPEDRRFYNPNRQRRIKIDGRQAEIRVHLINNQKNVGRFIPYRLRFEDHKKVVVCQKRKRRREELFKRKLIGFGKIVSKLRKWTEDSNIVCK